MYKQWVRIGAALALAVGLLVAATGSAAAQDSPANTLTVAGVGTASGAPDIAILELGVQIINSDVLTAFSEANDRLNAVRDAVLGQGIAAEDLQTLGLSLYQETPYDPQTGMPSERVIYRVSNMLRVTVRDVNSAGDVISAAVNAGANTINRLDFSLSDPAALQARARERAVADARARAEQLAALTGVALGAPVVVVEGQIGTPTLFPQQFSELYAFGIMGGGLGGAPVETGQLSVTVQVRVTYSIG
ncbi:MAG: SIMPL domain-containing protein [Aggregatilineales bacterium]